MFNHQRTFQSLGFGSCNRTDLDPKIWDDHSATSIWMPGSGWAILSIPKRRACRTLAHEIRPSKKSLPAYQKLQTASSYPSLAFGTITILARMMEEHSLRKKQQSRDLLFDFLALPTSTSRTNQVSGAYQSYCFGEKTEKVCLYLLDVRYFKEAYEVDPSPKQRYMKK
jgi:hypothetical protein